MSLLSKLLNRMPYIGRLRRSIREMRGREGRYPAGHYYSPIPSPDDVVRHIAWQTAMSQQECPDVDLHEEEQFALLQAYTRYYDEIPFGEAKKTGLRYYYGQTWFRYADAIFLYCHLRETHPQRIIEVGSGFSSAVILDTVEYFLPQSPDITLIEPNCERLFDLLKPSDKTRVRVIQKQVQDVPLAEFLSLEAGDLLFIDSSHTLKAGSDLYFLLFMVLPQLRKGVVVHFHDVFYPFEYRPDWLSMGRYWNEAYFLRAFLAYNSEWHIRFFNSYAGLKFYDYVEQYLPLCTEDSGGSVYIERR